MKKSAKFQSVKLWVWPNIVACFFLFGIVSCGAPIPVSETREHISVQHSVDIYPDTMIGNGHNLGSDYFLDGSSWSRFMQTGWHGVFASDSFVKIRLFCRVLGSQYGDPAFSIRVEPYSTLFAESFAGASLDGEVVVTLPPISVAGYSRIQVVVDELLYGAKVWVDKIELDFN